MKKTLFILLVLGISSGLLMSQSAPKDTPLIYQHYVHAQEALAADNFEMAKSAIKNLAEKSDGELKKLSEAASTEADLKSIREAFKPLSEFLAEQELPDGLMKVYCPMVKSHWLQKKGDISNPYLGKSMPSCGVIK
ncbi:MAG: hypothetical protein V3R45_08985 [Candidatus Aminicenantaceae bacterium]